MPDGSYGGNPCGFVIESADGNFYYSGDTALTLDMKLIAEETKLRFAVLPIGDFFTMGIDDAVRAAAFVGATKIVGVHYDTFPPIKLDRDAAFRAAKAAGKTLLLPGDRRDDRRLIQHETRCSGGDWDRRAVDWSCSADSRRRSGSSRSTPAPRARRVCRFTRAMTKTQKAFAGSSRDLAATSSSISAGTCAAGSTFVSASRRSIYMATMRVTASDTYLREQAAPASVSSPRSSPWRHRSGSRSLPLMCGTLARSSVQSPTLAALRVAG